MKGFIFLFLTLLALMGSIVVMAEEAQVTEPVLHDSPLDIEDDVNVAMEPMLRHREAVNVTETISSDRRLDCTPPTCYLGLFLYKVHRYTNLKCTSSCITRFQWWYNLNVNNNQAGWRCGECGFF